MEKLNSHVSECYGFDRNSNTAFLFLNQSHCPLIHCASFVYVVIILQCLYPDKITHSPLYSLAVIKRKGIAVAKAKENQLNNKSRLKNRFPYVAKLFHTGCTAVVILFKNSLLYSFANAIFLLGAGNDDSL